MVEVLHLAAVLPATIGLCCAVGDRRGRARSVVPAVAMLAAMLAMSAGWPLVPPLVWSALLLALGIAGAFGLRRRTTGDAAAASHGRHMQLHRALGLVVSAGLLVVSIAAHGGTAASAHAGHAALSPPVVAALGGAAGFVAYTLWLIPRSLWRRLPVVGVVEASAMGLMTGVMAIVPLIG
ncbi:hypothetical protein [Agromyces bauzanensis]|uniref:Uncharacterized protein n=1 Tax=Agromyces bauzanensis TaxID=1308924 RepID=A0A917PP45_9MICO|nr:hypothetical protein [Agromyces bauzanensis]GGJ85576.1 hypothetical protein GCM10011372_24850 [Agromyces bauzanensis]